MGRNVNTKGRRIKGRFGMLPKAVHDSRAYRSLSPRAAKLLLDLVMQYDGKNNGDITASHSVLEPYGWASKANLSRAVNELLAAGLICRTRKGGAAGMGCSLYALAWQPVDERRNPETGALKYDPDARRLIGTVPGTWKDESRNQD